MSQRYVAVETDFMSEWLLVDLEYPRGKSGNGKMHYGAKVVQQGLREDFAKRLAESLSEEQPGGS